MDLTEEQWEVLEPLIPEPPRRKDGVERVPRFAGIADSNPTLADRRSLEVASVVWATRFKPDFGWIELPIFGEDGYPLKHRGVVDGAPGLYFLGLPFQHTFLSETIGGVVWDARHVADHLTQNHGTPYGQAARGDLARQQPSGKPATD